MVKIVIKRLIKTKSKSTYKGKDGEEHHYYNLWLELDNGKRIQIKPAFTDDLKVLDSHSEYVG